MSETKPPLTILELPPIVFGLHFFPHHFRIDSPPFHHTVIDCAMHYDKLVVGAPRESSKTTILGFLYPSFSICYKKRRFILIITSNYTKSCGILDAIKKEIKENTTLQRHFRLMITKDAEGDSVIRHVDGFETRILCKGRDQIGSLRGEKFGAYRPDLIIVDDVEDDKMVENPELRQEMEDLFNQVILFLGERGVTQIIVIGTLLHDDSQLAKLLSPSKYKDFKKLLFRGRVTEDDGQVLSLWPERWTLADLDRMEKNDPVAFAKEIQNDPVSGMMTKFMKKDFRYWRIDNLNYVLYGAESEIVARGALSNCKAAIACDLAWETKRESDFSVILPAYLTPNSEILVETYFCKKGMRPDEMEEILFSMEQRLRSITGSSIPIGFEKAKLEKVMKWLLKGAMQRRNHYLLFKDLMWDADKIQRIVTRLQPRYAQHVIYHRQGMGDLEHQLLRVPSGTHDDLADALQGVVQLLEYPRQLKPPPSKEDAFMWWRRKAIEAKKPLRKRYVYGSKGKRIEIPAEVSYR